MGEAAVSQSRRRLLSIARSEIGRLERLVTDFLTYARPRALELEELPAADLLRGVRDLMAPQIDAAGAQVEIDDRSRGARVRVDPGMMRQLLINLMQNALQATADLQAPARVRLSTACEEERVVLDVEDNGPGIDPADRERVFELFYSTRKGGTGLGLAVVERIARAHGGRLEILAGAEGGARIRLSLPQSKSAPSSSTASESNSSSVRNCSASSAPQISQKTSVASPSSHSKT
jgi:signal transduction histidine kinase